MLSLLVMIAVAEPSSLMFMPQSQMASLAFFVVKWMTPQSLSREDPIFNTIA